MNKYFDFSKPKESHNFLISVQLHFCITLIFFARLLFLKSIHFKIHLKDRKKEAHSYCVYIIHVVCLWTYARWSISTRLKESFLKYHLVRKVNLLLQKTHVKCWKKVLPFKNNLKKLLIIEISFLLYWIWIHCD